MKRFNSRSVAAMLAFCATPMAQAAPVAGNFELFAALTAPGASSGSVPYDQCRDRMSGTADATCEKLHTDGPSGGLFEGGTTPLREVPATRGGAGLLPTQAGTSRNAAELSVRLLRG